MTFFNFYIPFFIFNKNHKESLSDIKINNKIISKDSKNIWIWIINGLLVAFISVIIEMPLFLIIFQNNTVFHYINIQ